MSNCMSDWWTEIDDEILAILEACGPMDPADLAKKLGMSTAAVCSCVSMLAEARRVRIRSVEATSPMERRESIPAPAPPAPCELLAA